MEITNGIVGEHKQFLLNSMRKSLMNAVRLSLYAFGHVLHDTRVVGSTAVQENPDLWVVEYQNSTAKACSGQLSFDHCLIH